ncbi:NAD-dependent epimerase/dehydratase family protein [Streptosporangium sp. NPDC020145]|uniref:NAD-dependent epimerase/dehydratase family protein n=1 Tax=Streptosporangium sp. NPDC020145 TaxID=3154694 RepID=UPI0034245BC7
MRLLILGGTKFLGRVLVEQALRRGHEVTTFNRGRSGDDVPGATMIRGDRTNPQDLMALADAGPWDAVIDPSGMTPAMVEDTTRALADVVGWYVFVSTVNVYKGWPTTPLTDASPLRKYTSEGPEGESGPDAYGREKVGCEQAVTAVFGERATVLRPSVILGPHEYVGRLPWWLSRIRAGGRVLAPGTATWKIQPIDVRDVAAFALGCAERRLSGPYNVAAPIGHATFGEFLTACREATSSTAELVWVDGSFLRRYGVREWTELPIWREHEGAWRVDASRAHAAGLTCRSIEETVTDTWRWLQTGVTVSSARSAELGISVERETAILTAWDNRTVVKNQEQAAGA